MNAPTITKPAADVTVPMQSNGVSPKVNPKDATNRDTVVKAWLKAETDYVASWVKAEAHEIDRQVAAAFTTVGNSIEATVDLLMVGDEKRVWKTLGYRSLKMWVDECVGDQLKSWAPEGRNALVRVLIAKGFTLTDAARLTGTSKATASRAANDGAADAKPPVPTSATDRAVKVLESIAAKANDKDRFSTSDLKRLSAELMRTVGLVNDELSARGGHTLKSAAEGTQSRSGAVSPATVAKGSK